MIKLKDLLRTLTLESDELKLKQKENNVIARLENLDIDFSKVRVAPSPRWTNLDGDEQVVKTKKFNDVWFRDIKEVFDKVPDLQVLEIRLMCCYPISDNSKNDFEPTKFKHGHVTVGVRMSAVYPEGLFDE